MQLQPSRPNLSIELADLVRELVLSGDLPPGERVNEVHLARQLGVSRTPLREALSRLVAEGALVAQSRRGFFAAQVSVDEVEQLYPIRAILDPAALRLAGIPPPAMIERLRLLNDRFVRASNPAEAVNVDDEWHLELLAGCPNAILIDIVRQLMWRTKRYELGLMRGQRHVQTSGAQHEAIIGALEAGDLDGACLELENNMSGGKQAIVEWLCARNRGGVD